MKENPRRRCRCKTCAYIEAHPKCGLNMMLMDGQPYGVVADKFKGKAGSLRTIKRHWDAQHKVHRQLLQAKATRDVKKGLELMECQEEVYNLSIRAAKIALGDEISENKEVKPDIKSFGSCLGPAAKVVEVLAKMEDDSEINQVTNINLSDPFTQMQAYEKYFSEMENDTSREGTPDSNGTQKPILQAEADEETGSVPNKE